MDLLYDVRCRLAHEGRYFDLVLPDEVGKRLLTIDWKQLDGPPKAPTKKKAGKAKPKFQMPKSFIAHITVDELRQIILEGAVEAAKTLVPSAA